MLLLLLLMMMMMTWCLMAVCNELVDMEEDTSSCSDILSNPRVVGENAPNI